MAKSLFSSAGIAIKQVKDDYIDLSGIYPGLYILGMKDVFGQTKESRRIIVR